MENDKIYTLPFTEWTEIIKTSGLAGLLEYGGEPLRIVICSVVLIDYENRTERTLLFILDRVSKFSATLKELNELCITDPEVNDQTLKILLTVSLSSVFHEIVSFEYLYNLLKGIYTSNNKVSIPFPVTNAQKVNPLEYVSRSVFEEFKTWSTS